MCKARNRVNERALARGA